MLTRFSRKKKFFFLVSLHFVLSLQSAFVLQPYLLFGNKYDNWLTNLTLLKVVSHKQTTASKPTKSGFLSLHNTSIPKISVTSPIIINMPNRELLAGKSSFV